MAEKDFAIEYACAKRMHQSFTIPGAESRQPLKVTYATAGLENDDAPTVVFISGMFGMRWIALVQHQVALKVGVRLVCVDRPSFGGSTPVPLSERISTWLLTLPFLMAHLKCSHIIPIATSAGTHYLLNTIYHLPSILPPKAPFTAILAPWIHPKHSQSTMMTFLASKLMPRSLVKNYWNNVSGFAATKLLPGFAARGGLMEGFSNLNLSLNSKTKMKDEDEDDDVKSMEEFGTTRSWKDAIHHLMMKYMFAENTNGANDEALLCLKKGDESEISWGVCDDVATFVPELAEEWKKFRAARDLGDVKLRIQVHYAASDNMSGLGGEKYFEECWAGADCGDAIDFESGVVEGTTHDSIGDPVQGVLEGVLREAKRCLELS